MIEQRYVIVMFKNISGLSSVSTVTSRRAIRVLVHSEDNGLLLSVDVTSASNDSSFPGGLRSRSVSLAILFLLVPKLIMGGSIPPSVPPSVFKILCYN